MDAKRSESVNSLGSELVVVGGGLGFVSNCVDDVLARSRVAVALDFARRVGEALAVVRLRAGLFDCEGVVGCCCGVGCCCC